MQANTPTPQPSEPLPAAAEPDLLHLPTSASDSYLLERDALGSGYTTWRHRHTWFVAGPDPQGSPTFGCIGTVSPRTAKLHLDLTADRELHHRSLHVAGVRTPSSRRLRLRRIDEVLAHARSVGGRVILRPVRRRRQLGAPVRIDEGGTALREAIAVLLERHGDRAEAVVEAVADGGEYRLLVDPDRLISAIHVDRQRVPDRPLRTVIGGIALYAQGALDRRGVITDVTDEIHPALVEVAANAARARPGLGHAEVHLRAADHTTSAAADRATVLMVDPQPVLGHHEFPHRGAGGRVTGRWLPSGGDGLEIERVEPDSIVRLHMSVFEAHTPAVHSSVVRAAETAGVTVDRSRAEADPETSYDLHGPLGDIAVLTIVASRAAGTAAVPVVRSVVSRTGGRTR